MPRRASFRIDAIANLYQQLRYAPRARRIKQMDAAEALAGEVDAQTLYPVDFIVYRVTGYRSDHPAAAEAFPGAAVRSDLVTFILRLSEDAMLPPDHAGRTALTIDEVARRLNVSTKTVQRYRGQGLICHMVQDEAGVRCRVVCFEDALQRFVADHATEVQRAAAFSRIGPEDEQAIIDEAREMRDQRGLSLSQAARMLARRRGRAAETLRALLKRHDEHTDQPIFRETGPIRDRHARIIERAWRLGVPVRRLADRFGRSAATIHRTINRQRAAWLRHLDLTGPVLPTFEHDDAGAIILNQPAAREDLDRAPEQIDVLALIASARGAEGPAESLEDPLLAAHHFLKWRAARQLGDLPDWPAAGQIDAIETDLRWLALLRRRLALIACPPAVRAIEQHLGRRLDQLPRQEMVQWLRFALLTIGRTVNAVDPSRGQRMWRRVTYDMSRALARQDAPARPERAIARHEEGVVVLNAPYRLITPWEDRFMPPQRWRAIALESDRLPGRDADLLARRYGWTGRPPMTVAAIANAVNLTVTAVSRRLQRIEHEIRTAGRENREHAAE